MFQFIRLISVGIIACLFLGGMAYHHTHARATGKEIILDMEPVDPRDVLLGHYIQIETPLHNLDTADFLAPKTGWNEGDSVYVRLAETPDGSWSPVELFMSPPLNREGLIVEGRVQYTFERHDYEEVTQAETDDESATSEVERWTSRVPVEGTRRDVLRVVYTIERYYADQETALALEDLRNEGKLRLISSVTPEGRMLIKGLEIEGERHIETLF